MASPSPARSSKTRSNRRARNLADKSKLALSILLLTIGLAACGQPRVALPGGTGTPAPDFAQAYAQARAACDGVRVSAGRAGSVGTRGRAAHARARARRSRARRAPPRRRGAVRSAGLHSRCRRRARHAAAVARAAGRHGCRAGGDSERARRHPAGTGRSSRDARAAASGPRPNRQALARTAPIGSRWISQRAEQFICGASGTRGGSLPDDTADSRSTTRRFRAIVRRKWCCVAPI